MNPPPRRRRILVADTEPALLGLLAVWLVDVADVEAFDPGDPASAGAVDLLVVDVPFPRHAAQGAQRPLPGTPAGVPVLALSSTFFGGVASRGAAARQLGVAAVLPKPVSREALLAAVHELLR